MDVGTTDDTGSDPDGYPEERGFEFDGHWYADAAEVPQCVVDGGLATNAVGVREDTGDVATAAWNFAGLPLPGDYTPSSSGVAAGTTEGALVLVDGRDDAEWLTDGRSGSISVFAPGAGAIDVVWHDVSLATTSGDVGLTTDGWTTCVLPQL